MERIVSRNLFLVAVGVSIVARILSAMAGAGNSTSVTGLDATTAGLALVALIAFGVAFILWLTGWIGALVRTARISRWGWFAFLLFPLTAGFTFLIYVFWGPDTRA